MKNPLLLLGLGLAMSLSLVAFRAPPNPQPLRKNLALEGRVQIAIQLARGNCFLTIVGGGGMSTDPQSDPIHTDRQVAQGIDRWEVFTLEPQGDGSYALQTANGINYLTAVEGGGRATDAIHTNATVIGPWEKFTLESQGNGTYALKTANGTNYLTAVGGRSQNAVRTDATTVGAGERFWLIIAFPL